MEGASEEKEGVEGDSYTVGMSVGVSGGWVVPFTELAKSRRKMCRQDEFVNDCEVN